MHNLWELALSATFLQGSLASLEGLTSLWNIDLESSDAELHIEGDLSSLRNLDPNLRKLAITNLTNIGHPHDTVALTSAIVFAPAQSIDHAACVNNPTV